MEMMLVGIDPGFAKLGWSISRVSKKNGLELERIGEIVTKKMTKKLNIRATDDNFRRTNELFLKLSHVVGVAYGLGKQNKSDNYKPSIMFAVESQSWPRNASNSAKLGMTWGVLACVCHSYSIEQVSPQAIKKHVTGSHSASKKEVKAAVFKREPKAKELLVKAGIAEGRWEHPVDAFAASLVVYDESEVVKLFK